MSEKIEIKYQEHSLQDVVRFFSDAFQHPNGKTIIKVEANVIPHDDKVIFKLTIREGE